MEEKSLREKIKGNLKETFSDDSVMQIMTHMLMSKYWPANNAYSASAAAKNSRQFYIAPLFNLTMDNPKLQQSCLNIVSFGTDLNETLADISRDLKAEDEEDKTSILSTLASLSLRAQAIEVMFEDKEITQDEYLFLKDEVELATKNFVSKLDDKIIINFVENLMNNSADRDSTESKNNEFSQIIFTLEMRGGNKVVEQILEKYLQLKPRNKEKLFDRNFFNFQGENLAGFLIEGGIYKFLKDNMPDDICVSFLATSERGLERFHEVEQDSAKREKTRFEQLSLKDTARKVEIDGRINSSVLTHGIANFLQIAERNPNSSEEAQATLSVVDLFDKLNKHIEKLSQELDETKRKKGFEEINYILNDVIKVGENNYISIADFLQNFVVEGDAQNEVLDKSWQNLVVGKNGIKLHTIAEMRNIVRSNPEKFNPNIIEEIFTKSNSYRIKTAKNAKERIAVLQQYITKEGKKIIIDESGLELLLASVQDNPELKRNLEMNIWTVIAMSYNNANSAYLAMQKWLTSEHYRLANVFIQYERGIGVLSDTKKPNSKIFANLEVSHENFPSFHRYLSQKADKQAKTGLPHIIGSPYAINELTRKRGFFGLGKRLCDQKMTSAEAKITKRVLAEAEFDDIKIYEILLKNAKNNNDRVGILKRALKLDEFNSSAVCLKFLKNVILDKNVSNENKKELLNSAKENTIIILLKSLSNKELVNLLNNTEVSKNMLSIPAVSKYIKMERLDKEIGFIFKTTVLKSLNMEARGILSKGEQKVEQKAQRPEQQSLQPKQEWFFVSIDGGSKPKKTKEEIEELLSGNTKFISSIKNFLENMPDLDNQALLLARTKLTEKQASNLYNAIKGRKDMEREFLSTILMNPEMNKQKSILAFAQNATREMKDAELWKRTIDYVEKADKIDLTRVPRELTPFLVRTN